MSEAFTTPEDRRKLWRVAIVIGGVVLIIAMLGSKAKASIGDNEDRRTVSRHETSSVAHHQRAARSGRAARPTPPGRRPAAPIAAKTAYASASSIPHPQGCPRVAFCACGAAVKIFGQSVRSLWPSTAWYKFPRSAPGHMKVAVRSGHVFVIDYMIDPKTAMAWDYNSGGHQSRYHARSIAGYRIVDPLASRVASLGNGKP